MKISSRKSILKSLKYLISIALVSGVGWGMMPVSRAATFHNGWNYGIDSFNDGMDDGLIGRKSPVEIYGMAMKVEGDRLYFAFNSNLSLNGVPKRRAYNNRISYGDLFLNFSNSSIFNPASDDV